MVWLSVADAVSEYQTSILWKARTFAGKADCSVIVEGVEARGVEMVESLGFR